MAALQGVVMGVEVKRSGPSAGGRGVVARAMGLWRRGELWVVLSLLAHCLTIILPHYRPLTYLYGDAPYYAAITASLVYDHDLELRNQTPGDLRLHNLQLALGQHGEWYPKHPIFVSLLAIPFFVVFGYVGCLITNVVIIRVPSASVRALVGGEGLDL
jgi:hypothetical protein